MLIATIAIVLGLALLVWSADRFVEGAAGVARHFGMPPLLIGMVIMGFGTSAPEIVVSTLASLQGNPGIALGNAYGSNIANIGLILGITALISPIAVKSSVLRNELPILAAITGLAAFQVSDQTLSLADGWVLLGVFAAIMAWTVFQGLRNKEDALSAEFEQELGSQPASSLGKSSLWLTIGLLMLIASSRATVWGAVQVAGYFGVSDLIIGLTVIAIGTSLPELAASIVAARKGEHDMALGNVIGSNLFNTLAVVGLAAVIHPLEVPQLVFTRDILVMSILTLSIFAIGFSRKGRGVITRPEGVLLLLSFVAYTSYLVYTINAE